MTVTLTLETRGLVVRGEIDVAETPSSHGSAWGALRHQLQDLGIRVEETPASTVSDVADTPPLAPWQGGPASPRFVSTIPSRAGGASDAPMMVDSWNVSSLN